MTLFGTVPHLWIVFTMRLRLAWCHDRVAGRLGINEQQSVKQPLDNLTPIVSLERQTLKPQTSEDSSKYTHSTDDFAFAGEPRTD